MRMKTLWKPYIKQLNLLNHDTTEGLSETFLSWEIKKLNFVR